MSPPYASFANPNPMLYQAIALTTKTKVDLLSTACVVLVETEPDSKNMKLI
jgi:hypothetical protein